MLPTLAVRLQLGNLLIADITTLNQAVNNNVIALVAAPFVPSETLTIASFTFATFAGYADILQPIGPALVGVNPITLQQQITIPDPAGGYRWVSTTAVGLPQTIYGWVLATKLRASLLASALLPAPVTLRDLGQVIDLGTVNLTFVNPPLT